VTIRKLSRQEIQDVWSIDRSEVVENVYYHKNGHLILKPEHYDMKGWPPGEPELYGPILLDCYNHGGTFYGAFDKDLFELEPDDIHLEYDIPA
jgi:predicted N-acetyltransferase YhbS